MNNALIWGRTGPLSINYLPQWESGIRELFDNLCNGITDQLDVNGITDYRLVFTELSDHTIAENIHKFSEKNIVIYHSDHLHHSDLLRYVKYENNNYSFPFLISDTILNLINAANNNPNKNILFYSVVDYLDRETTQCNIPSNLIIKCTKSGNLLRSSIHFKDCIIEPNKDFNSDKTFICLNNVNRPHRPAVVSYLLGKGLDPYGYITLRSYENTSIDCFLDWCFDTVHDPIKNILLSGFSKISKDTLTEIAFNPTLNKNYNALSKTYQKTFIEIITDTTYFEPSAFTNDKYVNNILGANFPIFISTLGTVNHLRQQGFDMFDDIVDHSYDNIVDPALRLSQAIELNLSLLKDTEVVKKLWKENKSRFINNYNFFKNDFKTLVTDIINQAWAEGAAELKLKCSNTV